MIVRVVTLVALIARLPGAYASCAIAGGGSAIYMSVDEDHAVGACP